MKSKRIPYPVTEAQHQRAVILWSEQPSIRKKYPELSLLHHIPNGGGRDEIEGAHLKQQGVRKGVPDLSLPVPSGKYHGLYIELKRPGGTPTHEQIWWMDKLRSVGFYSAICYGWEDAVNTIERYLDGTI